MLDSGRVQHYLTNVQGLCKLIIKLLFVTSEHKICYEGQL